MGHYAKRFFGKAKGESRDPDLVMTVDTSITATSTVAGRYEFVLKAGDKDVTIDWGDGTINNYTATEAITVGRTYATAGIYQIRIAGSYPGFERSGNYYNNRIVSLDNWGTNEFTDMNLMFGYARNMIANYTDKPNTSKVTIFRNCFFNALKFNGIVNFDTSNAVDLRGMFYNIDLLPQSFAHFNIEKLEPGTNTGLDLFMANTSTYTPLDMNEPGTTDNYDDTLISFASQNAPNGIVAHFGNSKYSDRGVAARAALVAKGWKITDGGPTPENDFVITVDCRYDTVYKIMFREGPKDIVIDWGNGQTSESTSDEEQTFIKNYNLSGQGGPGIYQIRVKGSFPGICPDPDSAGKIISLDQWGTNEFTTMWEMFKGELNMEANYTDRPNTSNITSMSRMFYNCSKFNGEVNFDTQNVTAMNHMFYGCSKFNGEVNFNTSNVTTMRSMFNGCSNFNQKVNFNTSKVTDMSHMFRNSKATSLDLSSFDTSNVTTMESMFRGSKVQSLDLSSFDTSKVTDMNYMFYESQATSLGLSSFDTSKVTTMRYMFYWSQVTSLDLSSFDTSNVTTMEAMFYWSQVTSLDLSSFDTSNVVNMKNMFSRVPALILDLSSFDTSKVTNTTDMFRIALATTGYAKTQADADKFNKSSFKPDALNFIVKPQ